MLGGQGKELVGRLEVPLTWSLLFVALQEPTLATGCRVRFLGLAGLNYFGSGSFGLCVQLAHSDTSFFGLFLPPSMRPCSYETTNPGGSLCHLGFFMSLMASL